MRRLNPEAFNKWIYDIIDDYSHRIEVYKGGAGSGKSYGACQKMLLKALKSKRRVLVIRKIGQTLRDSVWQLFIELIISSGFSDSCVIEKSTFRITLPNGSEFIFKGLDDPEKIKSITGITDIIIEEATEITLSDFTQLNLRLRPKEENPQIYLMFNPISKKNWTFSYWFSENSKIDKNTLTTNTTYKDNKFLTKDYCNELEKLQERNPAYYRIYTLGEYATLDKLVFPVYETRIISDEEIKGLPRWIGVDFGYTNDPSAIVWGKIDTNNKKLYITNEYVKKGMLNNDIARIMLVLGIAKDKSYGDGAEPKSIAEIKREGVNMEQSVKGKDSVIHGIQWMQQYEIIIDERCFKTIEEFENYTWKKDKKTEEYINEPVDCFNHTIDAIRYGLNKYILGRTTPKVINKPRGL